MKKIKLLILTSFLFVSSVFGCWYNRINYIDYIYGINDKANIVTLETTQSGNTTYSKYVVSNNQIVDLPLTVTCKLTSGSKPSFSDAQKNMIVNCTLQYRVLPNGNWVTVKQYSTPCGTIPFTAPPFTYFGQNNIWPKDIKEGDVIMVRMYITDGMYQSGNATDLCEDKLTNVSTEKGIKRTLPNFTYTIGQTSISNYDLGGGWFPNQCITVIWSGKTRPLH